MAGLNIPKIPKNPVPEDESVCPECGGLGWRVRDDGGAGAATECDCRRRNRPAELLAAAHIPERFAGCRLSTFQPTHTDPQIAKQLKEARTAAERYVDTFVDTQGRFKTSGLLFSGKPGVGKTHLAVAVLLELIERYQIQGRFVNFTTLLHGLQKTFDAESAETRAKVLDPVIDANVLVFDELQGAKSRPWVLDTLYLIINTRYIERRPTIFTTNFSLTDAEEPTAPNAARVGDAEANRAQQGRPGAAYFESLNAQLSPQLVSRLFEMAQVIDISGVDYRREVKVHQLGR